MMIKRKTINQTAEGLIDLESIEVSSFLKKKKIKIKDADFDKALNPLTPNCKKTATTKNEKELNKQITNEKETKSITGKTYKTNGVIDFTKYNLEEMTTQELINAFNIEITKKILDIKKTQKDSLVKDMDLQKERNDLVDRKKVGSVTFNYLDILNKKILNFPLVAVDRIIAISKSTEESSRIEVLDFLRTNLEKLLFDTRIEIKKKLVL